MRLLGGHLNDPVECTARGRLLKVSVILIMMVDYQVNRGNKHRRRLPEPIIQNGKGDRAYEYEKHMSNQLAANVRKLSANIDPGNIVPAEERAFPGKIGSIRVCCLFDGTA